ncbi:hypothetical protein LCGC14_1370730 [marine sediment metagenome]|uniref:Uncharacterized protein n=1 Tax=marine sediment metagenome TaxID=412755 RepID=A0A0F9MKP9_9ZZZZ
MADPIKRDEVIKDALWHVQALPADGRIGVDLLRRAVRLLNNIIRQDNLRLTGTNRALWALDYASLFLVAKQMVYTVADGLSPAAEDITTIKFRAVGGDDNDVSLVPRAFWDAIVIKVEPGDTTAVYLKMGRIPSDNSWFIHPQPSTVTAPSEVFGSDSKNYQCLLKHTSVAENAPGGGQNHRQFWQQGGKAATASWANETAYTTGEQLAYSFKRPLNDFKSAYDNPDMPLGWENYLTYKLALSMSAGRDTGERTIGVLIGLLKQAERDIFPSRQAKTTTFHNKNLYY